MKKQEKMQLLSLLCGSKNANLIYKVVETKCGNPYLVASVVGLSTASGFGSAFGLLLK